MSQCARGACLFCTVVRNVGAKPQIKRSGRSTFGCATRLLCTIAFTLFVFQTGHSAEPPTSAIQTVQVPASKGQEATRTAAPTNANDGLLAQGADRAARAGTNSEPIHIQHCRIKLIDEAVLACDRSGILDFVVLYEGDSVSAGAVVAQIRDRVARTAFAIAKKQASNDVEIKFARKASELAQVKYLKAVKANEEVPGAIAELDLRELLLAAQKSLLQLEQAQLNFEIAKLKQDEAEELLRTHQIVAPFDGIVRRILKKRGEAVREGEPIVEIVNTRRIRVDGFLQIPDAARVPRGATVQVRINMPKVDLEIERVTFVGRIVFVDVKIEPVSRKVSFWAEVDNRDGLLRDGLTADVIIIPDRLARQAVIPDRR